MIAALRHSLIPLAPTMVPEFRQEPRSHTARERPEARERQGRRTLDHIIDVYQQSRFEHTPLESTQIYDHSCAPVFLGPSPTGRLVDIYA